MPARTKDELLAVTRKELAKLSELIDTLPADHALVKDQDDTSIKDVIGHRAHWIDLFLGWYANGQAGKTVHFPAEGYKWNELKRYNAALRSSQADLSWDEARSLLRGRASALVDFIERHGDDDLYGGPMKGANNDWPTGRWAESAGASHFRSAAKYIRSRQRNLI